MNINYLKNKHVNYCGKDYVINTEDSGNVFNVILNSDESLRILVEGRGNKSIYFNILSYCKCGRVYKSEKYLYKWISLTRELAFILRSINAVWDYVDNCPLAPVRS